MQKINALYGQIDRWIVGAKKSRELLNKISIPGYIHYFRILEIHYIINCKVSIDDTKISVHFFGQESVSIKGKLTRKALTFPGNVQLVPIPENILNLHLTVILSIDYVYVQSILLIHSISNRYQFRTIEAVRGRSKPVKQTSLNMVKQVVNV